MTKYLTTSEIRKSFIEFFESKGHTHLPSAPLIPHNDPTLMFINAGMVQFKNIFNGLEDLKDKQGKDITKVVTSQKCVRAGGKHNDLDNVGYTKRHHTFFEMLGNFSFGEYFKEDAIKYAWEYLTETLGLPKDKLLVTVYHTDDEAYKIWQNISGLPDDKILRIATSDNFWSMGDEGPCGPCSEIFYDHGEEVSGGPPGSADEDGDRFVEIWNLVFMQYDKQKDGEMKPLPNPCIDTGMGLERMATVMQGIFDNFETDLFEKLIIESQQKSGKTDSQYKTSHKIITDHLRSTCFLIADGVLPSNEGRGYVLRRIMRRAMRHCHNISPKEIFMHKLVDKLISLMGDTYPELAEAKNLIIETITNEEKRFRETLENGLKLLNKELETISKGQEFSGDTAFKLYDTYGFPYDLTEDILREKNITINKDQFDQAMSKQKEMAKASWSGSGESASEDLWFDLHKKYGDTEFLGYDQTESNSQIIEIIQNGVGVDDINASSPEKQAIIITQATPFYAESGGQSGDKGLITASNGKFKVIDTKKFASGLFGHIGEILEGSLTKNEDVNLQIDIDRREKIKKNHSATHLVHSALRQVLGDHVTQKGSLVEEDYLRFDFSHNNSLSAEEIDQIEEQVNNVIFSAQQSDSKEMAIDDAKKSGALALFGEKYSDMVRVVSMADKYSVEFCGGTHVKNTAEIGIFRIIKETAVSSGVRRIEAVTHQKAIEFMKDKEQLLSEIQFIVKASEADIKEKISKLVRDKKGLEKQVIDLNRKVSMASSSSSESGSATDVEEVGGLYLIAKKLDNVQGRDLRGLIDDYKAKYKDSVILLVSDVGGKAAIAAGACGKAREKVSAVDIVRNTSEILGGKGGGGREDFAQGGAPSVDKYQQAFAELKKIL